METPNSTPNPEKIERELQPWGDITDPKQHSPAKFRYLIHAINPMATSTMAMVGISVMKDDPRAINKEEGDQTINLFSQPERLDQRVALSCSLVDQDHHGTWGRAGLIIETPQENVLITDSSDVGAIVMSRKNLLEQARKRHLLTADQLLQQTYSSSYNEVVVLANNEGKKVVLAGFFYKTTEDGTPMDEALYRKMSMHAQRLNLPLIPITEPNPYKENKITHTDERFSVQFGGKLYTLQGLPEWQFKAYGQSGFSVFASPDEMQQVFNYLRVNNVDEQEIEQLQKEYQEADRVRQQPKVTYDEQGNVTLVEKRSGYSTGEMKITVSRGGYARRVNIIEEAKKFSEMMADPRQSRMIEPYDRDVASPHEAEQVVQEAINNAPENEKGKLQHWWNEVRDSVIRQWEQNQERRGSYFGFSKGKIDLGQLGTFEIPKEGKLKLDFDIAKLLGEFPKKPSRQQDSTDKSQEDNDNS